MKKSVIQRETWNLIYFSIVGRLLLIFKDILLAGKVGTCCHMDNYVLALSTIMLPTAVIADGLIISMIPLAQIAGEDGGQERLSYTNSLYSMTFAMSLMLMALGYIFAPGIISLFGPGLTPDNFKEAILLFRLALPIISISWIRAISGGYLQSQHAFRAGAKGLISYPLVFIIYLIFFSDLAIKYDFMLQGLMIAGSIAIITQFYILIKAMINKGFRYQFKLDFKNKYIRKMLFVFVPVTLGFGIKKLNESIDNAFASNLPIGSISELNYANEIIGFFWGVFVIAIVTVLFPVLTENHNKDDHGELRDGIRYGFKAIIKFAIPVTIILGTMSAPIVRLFFERGAFDAQSTLFTSQALAYYSIGFIALTFMPMVTRSYYSIGKVGIPLYFGIVMFAINFGLNIVLSKSMGAAGIALSTSIASTVFIILSLYSLNKILGIFNYKGFYKNILKYILAGLAMLGGILATYYIVADDFSEKFLNNLFFLGLACFVGISLYLLVFKAFEKMKLS